MSISSAKAAANRLNAQKSTGPRTAEGKAISSRNAITHGLFSQDLLVGDEDPQQLQRLQQDVLHRMRPRDAVEAQIAEQYLSCAWRLKRLHQTEQYVYQVRAEGIAKQKGTSPVNAGEVMFRTIQNNPDTLEKLLRYEHRFFSTMLRCSRELRALQKEPIEHDEEEVNAQNEATGEATIVQNEPTDSPNSRPDQSLPTCLNQPLTPRASKLMAAVDATIAQSLDLKLKSAG